MKILILTSTKANFMHQVSDREALVIKVKNPSADGRTGGLLGFKFSFQ